MNIYYREFKRFDKGSKILIMNNSNMFVIKNNHWRYTNSNIVTNYQKL